MVCSSLNMDGVVAGALPDYNNLFCENLSKQVQISSILKACYEERIKLKKWRISEDVITRMVIHECIIFQVCSMTMYTDLEMNYYYYYLGMGR